MLSLTQSINQSLKLGCITEERWKSAFFDAVVKNLWRRQYVYGHAVHPSFVSLLSSDACFA